MDWRERVKFVIIGDGAVGKTCICYRYAWNHPPQEYIPTVCENILMHITFNDQELDVVLLDTPGQEDYDRFRPLYYPGTDVIFVCFSLTTPVSYENVKQKWYPELQQHCPTTPIILVGTKLDQRDDKETLSRLKQKSLSPVTTEQGLQLCKNINAVSYVECSAYDENSVKTLINTAICKALDERKRKKEKQENKKHCIMM